MIAFLMIADARARAEISASAKSKRKAALALNPDLSLDWGLVSYGVLLGGVATIAITVAPVASTWRPSVLRALKSEAHTLAPARSRLARVLVVTQLAFSVVLLVIAGLAYRSHVLLS